MLKKIFNKDSTFLKIVAPTIFVVFAAFMNWSFTGIIINILEFFNINSKPFCEFLINRDLKNTIDIGFWTFILTGLSSFFIYNSPTFNIRIRNKNMTSRQTYLIHSLGQNHNPKKLIIDLSLNFKSLTWYKIIRWLGGLKVNFVFPNCVDVNLDNTTWDLSSFIDTSVLKNINLDLFKALPETKLENNYCERFIEVEIITNFNAYEKEFINCKFTPASPSIFKKIIMKILICVFFEIDYIEHYIEISNN